MLDPKQVNASDNGYDEGILRALRRIIRAVDLYSRQLSIRHSLTGPQLVCMRELIKAGPMTPGGLARAVSLSPATISGILDRLEGRGYVTRQRRPQDKRQVLVSLTESGRALVERTPLPLHERFTQRLAELPAENQAEIDRVLQQIVGMLEAEELDAAPLLASWPASGEAGNISRLLDSTEEADAEPKVDGRRATERQ